MRKMLNLGIACINKMDIVNLYSKNPKMFKIVNWYFECELFVGYMLKL